MKLFKKLKKLFKRNKKAVVEVVPQEDCSLMNYSILLKKLTHNAGGGWLASVQELPGCYADGDTPEEALASIEQSIELWIWSATLSGHNIPKPEPVDL